MQMRLDYQAHAFVETELAPPYEYAGRVYEPSVVSYFAHDVGSIDLNANGWRDLVIPLNKGYQTGVDTRTQFMALMNDQGQLGLDRDWQAQMPVVSGARRLEHLVLGPDKTPAIATVQHETGDEIGASFILMTPEKHGGSVQQPDLVPPLPFSQAKGRDDFVNAHSLAAGDVNGDGRDDLVVGNWHWRADATDKELGPYVLRQQADGTFEVDETAVPSEIYDGLLDLHLYDYNGNGLDDLIVGQQNAPMGSRVLINQGGEYVTGASVTLPPSAYGIDNQLHLKTFSEDFTGNGIKELLILWSRAEPYYGGNYLQLLRQTADGAFEDVTTSAFSNPYAAQNRGHLEWSDYVDVLDINGDGSMDIVHSMNSILGEDLLHLNRGDGRFETIALADFLSHTGSAIHWGDFDQDGQLNALSFESTWNDSEGLSSSNYFNVYELDGVLPQYFTDGNATLVDRDGDDSFWNAAVETGDGRSIGHEAAMLYRLYLGGMGREPDQSGFKWWLEQVERGAHSLEAAAVGFINSSEFVDKADQDGDGALGIDEFLWHMYRGVFDREPDAEGERWWSEALQSGDLTLADGFLRMTQSDEFVKQTAPMIVDSDWLFAAT
jgi:hypothetical protein